MKNSKKWSKDNHDEYMKAYKQALNDRFEKYPVVSIENYQDALTYEAERIQYHIKSAKRSTR